MTARLLTGKPVAEALRERTAERARGFAAQSSRPPALALLAWGEDPAAERYFRQIEKQGGALEIAIQRHYVPEAQTVARLLAEIDRLNATPEIDGLLIQLPLPPHWDAAAVADQIDPARDVDGISPRNAGQLAQGRWAPVPNTAQAGLAVLDYYGIDVAGRRCVVVGRSTIVGRPLGYLLLNRHATVTFCHSKTRDLPAVTRSAEILLAATGRPGLIVGDGVAPGATVLDFGTSVDESGRLVGDVDAESVGAVAANLTPVPGGIGPVTTACLLATVLDLAERRRDTLR